MRRKRFGDMLVDEGIITPEELQKALSYMQQTNKKLGQALVDLGYTDDEEKTKLLSRQLNIPVIDLEDITADETLLEDFDRHFITLKKFIPYMKTDISVVVITSDPYDVTIEDAVKEKYTLPVEFRLASDRKLDSWITANIHSKETNLELNKVKRETYTTATYEIGEESEDSAVVRTVNTIIVDAIEMKASDIHIMPREAQTEVKYRIDGILHFIKELPINAHSALTTRIKNLSEMDISESRRPQDGKIQITVDNRTVDLRVSTLPSIRGEKIVIRILDKNNFELKIENLGFLDDTREKFVRAVNNPTGIVLLTGPTGSGKSTTLYTALNMIKDTTKNIITIEDPVEYQIDDITQVQVNPLAKLTFASGLRSILRQDPDIILVGEIRDSETAEIAVQAANTGHLVLSTLHTNDSASSLTRLRDMGLEAFMIADSLLAVVNQRLVRRLCDHCKKPYDLPTDDRFRRVFGIDPDRSVTMYRSVGCEKCRGVGYRGRTSLHEILVMDDSLKMLINRNATPFEIKQQAIENGMRTLKEDGYVKCLNGITTPDEVQRLVNL